MPSSCLSAEFTYDKIWGNNGLEVLSSHTMEVKNGIAEVVVETVLRPTGYDFKET